MQLVEQGSEDGSVINSDHDFDTKVRLSWKIGIN